MKKSGQIFIFFGIIMTLISCDNGKDHEPTGLTDPAVKTKLENYEVLNEGSFTSQSGSGTRGKIQQVSAEDGAYFIRLSKDFMSSFHTGTVTVYLSTSAKLTLSDKNSYQLVSVVDKGGEHFLKLSRIPDPKFTHGILWCGAAAIPFGYAEFT